MKALWPALYRVMRGRGFSRPDSEDLVQETLVRVWKRGKRFRSEEHLRRYVNAAARNIACSAWRRRRPEAAEFDDRARSRTGCPRELLQSAELEAAVFERLAGLDPPVAAFLDPGAEPPDYRSAASAAGVRPGALRTAVCRARQRLRAELTDLPAA